MARYRVVQQPSAFCSRLAVFDVEELNDDRWDCLATCFSLQEAEQTILKLITASGKVVETKVVRECEA